MSYNLELLLKEKCPYIYVFLLSIFLDVIFKVSDRGDFHIITCILVVSNAFLVRVMIFLSENFVALAHMKNV